MQIGTRKQQSFRRYPSKFLGSFSILFCILLLSNFVVSMRWVVQRVKSASVTVDGKVISSIGQGATALVGLHENDTKDDLEFCCKKLLACKLWENDNGGLWRHGVKQRNLEVLCVSQFTLYGTLTKKNQPDYKRAMKAIPAQEMYNEFLELLKSNYEPEKIFDGQFGAMMDVALVNDGPVTIVIESTPKEASGETKAEDSKEGTS
jgi:D-tyrosyl-tRNA(Tyr) deacylase